MSPGPGGAMVLRKRVANTAFCSEFTHGTFRKEVEQALSLEPGTLDARELKDIVHAVAKNYIVRRYTAAAPDACSDAVI